MLFCTYHWFNKKDEEHLWATFPKYCFSEAGDVNLNPPRFLKDLKPGFSVSQVSLLVLLQPISYTDLKDFRWSCQHLSSSPGLVTLGLLSFPFFLFKHSVYPCPLLLLSTVIPDYNSSEKEKERVLKHFNFQFIMLYPSVLEGYFHTGVSTSIIAPDFQPKIQFFKWRWTFIPSSTSDEEKNIYVLLNAGQMCLWNRIILDKILSHPLSWEFSTGHPLPPWTVLFEQGYTIQF